MALNRIEFFSGIILVSKQPAKLATFYREVLGIPMEEEEHGDNLPHWGCTFGDVHFAVHAIEDFPDRRAGVGAVKLAFTVFDVWEVAKSLEAAGVALLYPPRDTGYFVGTAIQDPDGNLLEFTELCDEGFEHISNRRKAGMDVVQRWQTAKGPAVQETPAQQ